MGRRHADRVPVRAPPEFPCRRIADASSPAAPRARLTRVAHRHYATLYFIFCVDDSESELGILDLIQVFVESLDRCFENVCELDLVFHMDRVHAIMDEIVQAGMVLETNIGNILKALDGQRKHEQATNKVTKTVLRDPNAPDPKQAKKR